MFSSYSKYFLPEIYNVLDRLKIIAPTTIQSVAIPRIIAKKHTYFTAQTGTGKTFCYLLPLLHDLKLSEQVQQESLTSPRQKLHKEIPRQKL